MPSSRTIAVSGVVIVGAVWLSGCSARTPAATPAHAVVQPASSTASPSASASGTTPAPNPSPTHATPRPTPTPKSRATSNSGAGTSTGSRCASGCPATHHAPTAQDGLHENPGPRPTGQATGPGTVPQPGTSAAGQGPSLQTPVVLSPAP
jgi:hypothetical protein